MTKTLPARLPGHVIRGFEFVDAALRQSRPDFRRRMAEKAVGTDPSNPYAHAFLGHQTLDPSEALVSYIVAGRLAETWRHSSALEAPYRPGLNLALATRDFLSGEPSKAVARLRPSIDAPHISAGVVIETRRLLLAAAAAAGDGPTLARALKSTDAAFLPLEAPWFAFLQAVRNDHPDVESLWNKAKAIAPGVGTRGAPLEVLVNPAYRASPRGEDAVKVARACVMPGFLSVEGASDRL